jgi:hypothetical protein
MLQQARARVQEYLPLVRPYLPHAAALLVFALLGWMNGYFHASRTVSNPSLKETWSVPTWTPTQLGPERTLVVNLDIWDGAKPQAAAKPAATQLPWRFIGTVRAGDEYAAVILMRDTGKVRRFSPGDALPNGEKIVAVGHGSLQLEVAGAPRELRLFKPENNPEKK